jgi:hypothetical protein
MTGSVVVGCTRPSSSSARRRTSIVILDHGLAYPIALDTDFSDSACLRQRRLAGEVLCSRGTHRSGGGQGSYGDIERSGAFWSRPTQEPSCRRSARGDGVCEDASRRTPVSREIYVGSERGEPARLPLGAGGRARDSTRRAPKRHWRSSFRSVPRGQYGDAAGER